MSHKPTEAPGAPGKPLVWNCGRKDGVGAAFGPAARHWFTMGRGTFEEVYYPRAGRPCVRDLGFAVADGKQFFSWEKDDADQETLQPARASRSTG